MYLNGSYFLYARLSKRDVLWYGAVRPSVCLSVNFLLHSLSDFDQTWYIYLLGHATPDVGLILKFDPGAPGRGL